MFGHTDHRGYRMGASPHLFLLPLVLAGTACSRITAEPDTQSIETAAHGAYVLAINSNDTDVLMADLTEDVVFQFPGAPELVGKAAVRKWVSDYFGAYQTKWEKTSLGFTVAGDSAFERYSYKSTDTDRKTGQITTDTGKGINVFRKGQDGKWRVAIDGWSSDKAA